MKTVTEERTYAWLALADAKSCRLLCCTLARRGRHHVDEYGALENTIPEQEHFRPMTNAGTSHNIEETERRFGSEIVEWLGKKAAQHKFDRLVIFAPPRMLGVLRTVPLGSLKGQVEELKGDLMGLKPGQLADHPMIRALVIPQMCDEGPATDVAAISTPGAAGSSRRGRTGVDAFDEISRN